MNSNRHCLTLLLDPAGCLTLRHCITTVMLILVGIVSLRTRMNVVLPITCYLHHWLCISLSRVSYLLSAASWTSCSFLTATHRFLLWHVMPSLMGYSCVYCVCFCAHKSFARMQMVWASVSYFLSRLLYVFPFRWLTALRIVCAALCLGFWFDHVYPFFGRVMHLAVSLIIWHSFAASFDLKVSSSVINCHLVNECIYK